MVLRLTIRLLAIGLLRLTVRLLAIGLLTVRLLAVGRLTIRLLAIRRLTILLLHLHLLHIGLRRSIHEALCSAHAHADTHEGCGCAVRVGTGGLNTSGNGGLYEGFTHTRVIVNGNTVSLLEQLLGVFIIGDAGDTNILDFQTTILTPYRIKSVTHIFSQSSCLGRNTGQRLSEHGNAAECFAQSADVF